MKRYWMFGVFDGHGPNGHKVSHFIKKKLPEKIINRFIINHGGQPKQQCESEKRIPREDSKSMLDQYNSEDSNNFSSAAFTASSTKEVNNYAISMQTMKDLFKESILETDKCLEENALRSGSTC
jgi:serine/threonine protein phosphatase PrpC